MVFSIVCCDIDRVGRIVTEVGELQGLSSVGIVGCVGLLSDTGIDGPVNSVSIGVGDGD